MQKRGQEKEEEEKRFRIPSRRVMSSGSHLVDLRAAGARARQTRPGPAVPTGPMRPGSVSDVLWPEPLRCFEFLSAYPVQKKGSFKIAGSKNLIKQKMFRIFLNEFMYG